MECMPPHRKRVKSTEIYYLSCILIYFKCTATVLAIQSTLTQYINSVCSFFYFVLHVLVIQIDHHQVKNTGTKGKVLQKRPPFHKQSTKNTLCIITKRGIMKRNNKTMKLNKIFPCQ